MRPITVSVGPLAAASSTAIRSASAATGSGPLTLVLSGPLVSGGVATLDVPRRILLTVNADESAKTVTLTGTTFSGNSATETITLPSATGGVASAVDFKTVTSAVSSTGLTSTLAIGTTAAAGSQWVYFDPWANPVVSYAVSVSGSATYSVQETMDDPNDPTSPVALAAVTWFSATAGATGSALSAFTAAPRYGRVVVTAGATGSSSAAGTFEQFGVVPK